MLSCRGFAWQVCVAGTAPTELFFWLLDPAAPSQRPASASVQTSECPAWSPGRTATQVLPEVAAREAEERRKAEEERANLRELMKKGRLPKGLEELVQEEQEEVPDEVIEVGGTLGRGSATRGPLRAAWREPGIRA